jgi:hypothetical protein
MSVSYRNEIQKVINHIKTHNPQYDSLKDLLDLCIWQLKDNPNDKDYCFKYSKYIKDCAMQLHMSSGNEQYGELFENGLLFEAPHLVDSFFYYIELGEKDPYKRFYFPRREVLKPVVNAYQKIYDGKLDFLSVSQPKRTGKTTGGLRLALMMGGREPEGSVFAVGKGEGLVKRFYGGLTQVFDNAAMYERFLKVFPEAKKVAQSAEGLSIDLKEKSPSTFPTYTCRPIDGAIVGCTEANVLVYIDDCVKNHEEARNRERLEFLCEKVTDDVLGRRLEGTPVIIQGTKYSLYDPITAMQNKADELEWRWEEVAIPALDPITDESNWEIYRKDKKGIRKIFTTDYYRKERKLVSEETWAAEFQQEPYEAKGRMFPEKELILRNFQLTENRTQSWQLAIAQIKEKIAAQCQSDMFMDRKYILLMLYLTMQEFSLQSRNVQIC